MSKTVLLFNPNSVNPSGRISIQEARNHVRSGFAEWTARCKGIRLTQIGFVMSQAQNVGPSFIMRYAQGDPMAHTILEAWA